jgi:hypothetical protein
VGLYSVACYVRGVADGLPMPQGVPGPLKAYITPPVSEKLKEPRAYIWPGRVDVARQSAPRGPGFRKRTWPVSLYLGYLDTPDDALANEPFMQVIDAVTDAFETTVMPLFIDAAGNPVGPNATAATDTQITSIGENWGMDYPPERTTMSLRQLWFSTEIQLRITEVVQG